MTTGTATISTYQPPPAANMSWGDAGLDPRLLRALAKLGFGAPTPVQAAAIPKALEGKDIVARAGTGSGKTLAYLLPALHKVLASGDTKTGWRALVLVPTRELCEQVRARRRPRAAARAAAARRRPPPPPAAAGCRRRRARRARRRRAVPARAPAGGDAVLILCAAAQRRQGAAAGSGGSGP
jgi:Rad3-related DNA helicase